MKIKSRAEILNDIIEDSKNFPKGWRAAFGKNDDLFSNDYYIFNQNTGLYFLREYQKNPFQIKGIGTKIARHIDDDISEKIYEKSGDFGIIQGNIQRIIRNIDKGIHPQKILEEELKGKNLGITIPVKGKASNSKDAFNNLQDIYQSKQKKLNLKLKK